MFVVLTRRPYTILVIENGSSDYCLSVVNDSLAVGENAERFRWKIVIYTPEVNGTIFPSVVVCQESHTQLRLRSLKRCDLRITYIHSYYSHSSMKIL